MPLLIYFPEMMASNLAHLCTRRHELIWRLVSSSHGRWAPTTQPLALPASTSSTLMHLCVLRSTTTARLVLVTNRSCVMVINLLFYQLSYLLLSLMSVPNISVLFRCYSYRVNNDRWQELQPGWPQAWSCFRVLCLSMTKTAKLR